MELSDLHFAIASIQLLMFLIQPFRCLASCSSFPVIHGNYYSSYFGSSQSFPIWAAVSLNADTMDVASNSDIIIGYDAIIK